MCLLLSQWKGLIYPVNQSHGGARINQVQLDINWYITSTLWHSLRLNPRKITPNTASRYFLFCILFTLTCACSPCCSTFHPTVCDYEDNKAGKNQRVKIQFPLTNISFSFLAKLFPQKTNIKLMNCWICSFKILSMLIENFSYFSYW